MMKPTWELDESTLETSKTHTLDIGPLQLRARSACGCGCGNTPHWDLEVPDHGDECESLSEAQAQAELVAHEIYVALRDFYGDGDEGGDAIAAERERSAAELAVLTERMEAAIAEACAAVRARTIEECARFVEGAERLRWSLDIAADMRAALATPTPTTETAPVDPAAGASHEQPASARADEREAIE
jgi:hypothetical protein